MSLKKYKNKSELIEDEIDQFELDPFRSCGYYWWNSFYFYDDYDDDYWDYNYSCDNCGQPYCQDYDHCQDYKTTHTYEEMKVYLSKLRWRVVSKSYARWSINEPSVSGFYIDMESIYGDIEKRNRRIDIVLGLMKDDKYTPTIGDLYPNLK